MAVCGKCHRDAPDGALFCAFCGEAIKPLTSPGQEIDPLIGRTLGGKYFIHQLLGHGGMGDVYKATHLTLDRPVVLKLLKKLFHSDQSLVQRLHREARAASRLNHPNSITIIDFGQTDDGMLFMAMEYLAGRSLERVIADDKTLQEPRVVHVGAQILAALAEAHALGIIHRDLKPANVMIESRRDEPDFVKVLDFGIAKLNEPGGGGPGLTQAGIVCGTPGYMSTEQVRGEELDARSDLYAVGVILYEMLTGLLPFDSDTPMGLVTRHLVDDPPPLAVRRPGLVVSAALEAVIMRALARDRRERFASADEMRATLLSCAVSAAPSMRPTPAPSSTMIFDPAVLPSAPPVDPSAGASNVAGGPGTGAKKAQSTHGVQARAPTGGATPGSDKTTPGPGQPAPLANKAPEKKTPSPPRPRVVDEKRAASPARKKTPIIVAATAGGLVVIALVVWGATRGSTKPADTSPADKGPLVANAPSVEPAPLPTPPQQDPPSPPPVAVPPGTPKAEPPSLPPVAMQPGTPKAEPPPRPPPAVDPKPPKPKTEVVSTAHRPTKGIRSVGQELNSIATPPVSSGDGVLAIVATPWGVVSIDGRTIGETPREVRLGAGAYRVRVTHPALGMREQGVTIRPGKRQTWSPTFAN
jgi:serine/threonine-protein kinase